MATPPPLLKIDASNRDAHYYLEEAHECYFFHEYAARKGYTHSAANSLISNLKKSVVHKGEAQYKYKNLAIVECASMLRAAFEKAVWVFTDATIASIPPSKALGHPEYDDRMTQIVKLACLGKGADVRELLAQDESYDASHTQMDGQRKKPHELEEMYAVQGQPPRGTVILVDDVLTTGAHFVAGRNVILAAYPGRRVMGIFIARRVPSDPFEHFDAL